MQLIDFLKAVLPEEGIKCWVTIKNKKVTQKFTETLDELAAEIESASHIPGGDIYHACATFKDNSSRRGQNALLCKAFWLDIDCGEGKPYATAEDGISAVDEFANRLGVPLPLCVHSGRGIHAYWPLTEPLPAQRWTETARVLKRAAEVLGLHADPSRTADVSSILRPPGTVNTKNGGIITCDGECERISFESFATALARADGSNVPTIKAGAAASPALVNANILGGLSGSPSFTQGYPDGERTRELQKRAGYLLAKGHSYDDTLARCRAWNEFNNPPLADDKIVHDTYSYAKREEAKRLPAPAVDPAEFIPDPIKPFRYNKVTHALEMVIKDENGEEKIEVLSPYYIYLKAVCRKEREDKFSYIFRQWHPHNGWHEFQMTAGEFESSNWRVILYDNGGNISSKLFKCYVEATAVYQKGLAMDTKLYEQFGWKDDDTAFLLGNALIKNNGTAEFAYGDRQLTPRMKSMALPKGGSKEAWTAAANRLGAIGYEAHLFSLVCGMAAPLMRFMVGATDGGAILHLYSKVGGKGKSKILEAVSSVWGQKDALSTAGMDTDNAKFQVISRSCNLPVCEEELGWRDPIIDAGFVKRFTTGRDKLRAQRDGSVPYKDTRYQTILLSAANRSLLSSCRLSGDDGAVARVFEIEVQTPEGDDFKYFNQVADQMIANCGYAGRAIISSLLYPGILPWVKKELREAEAYYIKYLKTQGSDRYVVWLLCAAKVMSKLVNAAGILQFDVERLMKWAEEKAALRIVEMVDNPSAATLSEFISAHQGQCLTVQDRYRHKHPTLVLQRPQREFVMRMEVAPERLYIEITALKEWLAKKRYDYNTMRRELTASKVLLRDRYTCSMAAGVPELPPGRTGCWEIDTSHVDVSGGLREVEKEAEAPVIEVAARR